MLKQLRLTNFQIHKSFTVDFGPYVNTIVGDNRTGKSTIIRALRWLATNKGRTKGLLNHNSDYVRVDLDIDDCTISRNYGAKNWYKLNKKFFEAIGTKVPEEIEKILNISEDNFQGQLDAPYWFLESPGQVSKNLNRIVNLELIDDTLARINSKVRLHATEVTFSKERLDKAKKDRDALLWVRDAENAFRDLEELARQKVLIQEERGTIERILLESESLRREKVQREKIQSLSPLVEELGRMKSEYEKLKAMKVRIESLVRQIKQQEETKCQVQKCLRNLERDLKKVERCPLCGKAM